MTRQAIIKQSTGEVMNVHIAWEPPAGHIVVNSDTAQPGDFYVNGQFTPGAERQAQLDEIAAQQAIEAATKAAKDIADAESKTEKQTEKSIVSAALADLAAQEENADRKALKIFLQDKLNEIDVAIAKLDNE